MTNYFVQFEIEGPAAMFARPDTGAAPISYPAPTWSACKAMCESVARGFFRDGGTPGAFFSPTKVELLKPIRFEKYVTNYRGPLRKLSQINKQASYQLPATILVDVCYRISADCVQIGDKSANEINAAHGLQEMFKRRLGQGKSKYAPCLGWKEFLPTYFGPPRDHETEHVGRKLQEDINMTIPALLLSVWDAPARGAYRPTFFEGMIEAGVLKFPAARVADGQFSFEGG